MTYRDLTIGDWIEVWRLRIVARVCAWRGHHWGAWEPDYGTEYAHMEPHSRMCERCLAAEHAAHRPEDGK